MNIHVYINVYKGVLTCNVYKVIQDFNDPYKRLYAYVNVNLSVNKGECKRRRKCCTLRTFHLQIQHFGFHTQVVDSQSPRLVAIAECAKAIRCSDRDVFATRWGRWTWEERPCNPKRVLKKMEILGTSWRRNGTFTGFIPSLRNAPAICVGKNRNEVILDMATHMFRLAVCINYMAPPIHQ
jgi:hypothetical protein